MPGQAMTEAYIASQETGKRGNIYTDESRADALTDEPDLISPNADGDYEIWPVECFSDCLAVAPLPTPGKTAGGIVLPTAQQKDAGIVLGRPLRLADDGPCYPHVGQVVLFSAKNAISELTGKIPEYGSTRIHIIRLGAVFAGLPDVPTKVMG